MKILDKIKAVWYAIKIKKILSKGDFNMKNILSGKKKLITFGVGVVSLFLTHMVGLDEATTEQLMEAVIKLVAIFIGGEVGVDIVRSIKSPLPPVIDAPKTTDDK